MVEKGGGNVVLTSLKSTLALRGGVGCRDSLSENVNILIVKLLHAVAYL